MDEMRGKKVLNNLELGVIRYTPRYCMGLLDHGYENREESFCSRSSSIVIACMLDLVAFIL